MIGRGGSLYARLRLVRNRLVLVRKRLRHVDPTSYVHPSSRASRDLVGAPYVFVGRDCDIGARVEIGRYSMLAARVAVVGGDHEWSAAGVPMQFAGRSAQETTRIGADAWIGFGATVLRGVTVGDGSIVAAGAVVVSDVPAYEVWGGVPARKIRDRFHLECERSAHERMLEGPVLAPHFVEPHRPRVVSATDLP